MGGKEIQNYTEVFEDKDEESSCEFPDCACLHGEAIRTEKFEEKKNKSIFSKVKVTNKNT